MSKVNTYTVDQVQRAIKEKVLGRVVPCHTDDGHFYSIDGGPSIESVTTMNIIDKPHLIPWAARLAVQYVHKNQLWDQLDDKDVMRAATTQHIARRDDAGSVGGVAHDAIEKYVEWWIRTGERPDDIKEFLAPDADYRSVAAARAASKAFDKYKVTPIAAELLVGVDGVGAGTLDLLVLNEKGQVELWDWKTSNQVNEFYAAQVAAYAHMFTEMTGVEIADPLRICKLSKDDATFKVYTVTDRPAALELFDKCALLFLHRKNHPELLKEDKKVVKIYL